MKVCVFGAGALGGHIAAQLIAAKNAEVSVVGRGAQLAAIREHGLTLKIGGRELGGMPVAATDDPTTLPPQDIVFVALKAHTLPAAAEAIGKLTKPDGCVVFLVNGIPWWFNFGLPANKGTLPLLDPGAVLWTHVRPERVIGSVAYSPNEVIAPGVIQNSNQNRWVFGEPDGSSSARLARVADLVRGTGVDTTMMPDIRSEIFRKLANNASNNSPVDVGVSGTPRNKTSPSGGASVPRTMRSGRSRSKPNVSRACARPSAMTAASSTPGFTSAIQTTS